METSRSLSPFKYLLCPPSVRQFPISWLCPDAACGALWAIFSASGPFTQIPIQQVAEPLGRFPLRLCEEEKGAVLLMFLFLTVSEDIERENSAPIGL